MELVKGDNENLKGNAVIYWEVEGENLVAPDSKIIAINIIVSAIPLDDKLFTATFPPVSFRDNDELMSKLVNVDCDIIYGGKVMFPTIEADYKRFIKGESIRLNKIIEEYTDKYKVKFNFEPSKLSEKEQIYLLDDLSKKIRVSIKEGKYINGDSDSKPAKILRLIKNIKNNYKKYDMDSFLNILYIPGEAIDKLTSLYTKKFLAIFYEDYEEAQTISEEIQKIEKGYSKSRKRKKS